ncbi:lyase family protein [Ascidiaceihabitans sp.]|uniref:lyase family protein n=1 Tax=Ascidiaceihabitans sp. TaxID=1872644 RepID=UPI00329A22D2
MAASVFDSPLYAQLFPSADAGRLFTDSADVRAMVLVEGALAKVQGAMGVIPELSGAAIHRASLEVQLDPGALAQATGQNGVSVPGLVALLRSEMQAPEHSAYVHWGATSQDIIDTSLMLRLRQALGVIETDIRAVLTALADHAETHARTPMPARTYGQHATPTSWGAVVAAFGHPLLDALAELDNLRATSLWVSLSGAAGTASALGSDAAQMRADLAKALGLQDPRRSWHTDRAPILRIVDWMVRVVAALGAMGQTLLGLTATEVGEVRLGGAGSSSTMPQKQNPVVPSVLVALSHHVTGLRATMQTAAQHQHQRDGAAWFAEWLALPQIVLSTASAATQAKGMAQGFEPDVATMASHFDPIGLIHAEALSFALAAHMSRPEAQTATKDLCTAARAQNIPLRDLAIKAHPQLDKALFTPHENLGLAPTDAVTFARAVRDL